MSKPTNHNTTSTWNIRTQQSYSGWRLIIMRDGKEFYKSCKDEYDFSWTAKMAAKRLIRSTIRREKRETPVIFTR